tara:strand:+ start:629 stop:856 length:228 start_codon:yes stop_codon:yes gene_type:complete
MCVVSLFHYNVAEPDKLVGFKAVVDNATFFIAMKTHAVIFSTVLGSEYVLNSPTTLKVGGHISDCYVVLSCFHFA